MLMYFMTKTLAFHTIQKNVWLREIIHEEQGLDANDLSYLQSVAYLCPLEYGPAVYEAQALLLQYNSLDFASIEDPCPNAFPRNSTTDDELDQVNIIIYPNPSVGNFTIQSTHLISSIEVYQNGRQIMDVNIDSEKSVMLDLSAQPNGIYQLRIKNANEVIIKQIVKIE